jgi:hypothetical protein
MLIATLRRRAVGAAEDGIVLCSHLGLNYEPNKDKILPIGTVEAAEHAFVTFLYFVNIRFPVDVAAFTLEHHKRKFRLRNQLYSMLTLDCEHKVVQKRSHLPRSASNS